MSKKNNYLTKISGYNIIFPLAIPWNQCADFQKQTVEYIKKKNRCFVYLGSDKKPLIKFKKKHNLFLFFPMSNFLRIKFFNKFFDKMNLIIFNLLVKLSLKNNDAIDIIWLFNSELNNFFNLFKKQVKIKIYDLVDFADLNNIFDTTKKADLIFANSNVLFQFADTISNKKVVRVPQGFDLKSFNNDKKLKSIKPSKKITISYIGSINFRFDFRLIHKLIEKNPQHNFIFWGPIEYLDKNLDTIYNFKTNIKILRKYKNVQFGQSDRKGVIKLLEKTTIGIIPYNTLLDFNRNSFPMKLFEYFYMGLPVISTGIEELFQYKKIMEVSNNYEKWNKFINQIENNGWPAEKRKIERKFAEANSWQEKINKIEKEIYTFIEN
jgi:hypothetical protein